MNVRVPEQALLYHISGQIADPRWLLGLRRSGPQVVAGASFTDKRGRHLASDRLALSEDGHTPTRRTTSPVRG